MSTPQPPSKQSSPVVLIAFIAVGAALIGGFLFYKKKPSMAGGNRADVFQNTSATPSPSAPSGTASPASTGAVNEPVTAGGTEPTASVKPPPAIIPATRTETTRPSSSSAGLAVSSPAATLSTDGVIGGVVRLAGTPPAEREITPIRADRLCGPTHTEPVMTRNYTVGTGQGLGDVVVAVTSDLGGIAFTAPQDRPLIDQVGCIYLPRVTTLMTNQTVRIRNSDSFLHNVNATARVNRPFNFAQAVAGQENPRIFSEPEAAIKLICNVHPWMAGYVWVFAHPFHAVTDRDGRWKFSQPLPPGRYEITYTHLKAGTKTATVEVTAAGAPQMEAELQVPAL